MKKSNIIHGKINEKTEAEFRKIEKMVHDLPATATDKVSLLRKLKKLFF